MHRIDCVCCDLYCSVLDYVGSAMKRATRALLDVSAAGGAIIGSALVAMRIGGDLGMIIAYVLFLLSAIASVIILRGTAGTKSLTFTNLYFIVINVVGIIVSTANYLKT